VQWRLSHNDDECTYTFAGSRPQLVTGWHDAATALVGENSMTEATTFRERLTHAVARNQSLLCVGLDPVLSKMPAPLRSPSDPGEAIVEFNARVIAATADLVCAYKPNLGFYLAHGAAGAAALAETRRRIPAHIPVILDAKVGDLGNTSEAYAAGYYDEWGFDAVTVNPYLGEDSLEPFLRRPEKGVIVLCKTSNPGSGDFQDLPVGDQGFPLSLTVAERVSGWAERWPATLGLVVGATYPDQLAAVRQRCPDLPILLPGVGAQAGDLDAALRAGLDAAGAGLIVTASRSVIFAGSDLGEAWAEPVRSAAIALRESINRARSSHSPA
jgi:orotidine-5'-phosphate decarboxylase